MEASLAQALVAQSAFRIASRASMKLGLTGVIFKPSVTSSSVVLLPAGTKHGKPLSKTGARSFCDAPPFVM